LAWIDRLVYALNPRSAVGESYVAKGTYILVRGLYLSGDPGQFARGTVSGPRQSGETKLFAVLTLGFSEGEELFAQSAISALEFSPVAGWVAWALSSRR